MNTDSLANRRFAEAASPLNWYEVAKLLHENAQILHEAPQGTISFSSGGTTKVRRTSNRAVFLLAAFALENLVKAYLIHQNPTFIEGGRLAKELLNRHGLSGLQKICKHAPAPKRTRHVFETLEVGVNSWARYPCSTSAERESEERAVTPEFWAAYIEVFAMYSARLERLLSKKWKGAYGAVSYAKFRKPEHVA